MNTYEILANSIINGDGIGDKKLLLLGEEELCKIVFLSYDKICMELDALTGYRELLVKPCACPMVVIGFTKKKKHIKKCASINNCRDEFTWKVLNTDAKSKLSKIDFYFEKLTDVSKKSLIKNLGLDKYSILSKAGSKSLDKALSLF